MDKSSARQHGGKRGGCWVWALLLAWGGTQLVHGQAYTFGTLAGLAGSSGSADGTGSNARFLYPAALATSGATNVIVADSNNHTIRRVTTAGGVVTTIAGAAGVPGSADGAGSSARFRNPYGVAVDGAGTIYVADSLNHTIRKITTAGVVSTVAGAAGVSGSADGAGGNARFNTPCGLAFDGAGNLFIADAYNHTIRKLTPAGVVTTFAGAAGVSGNADGAGGNARFFTPRGVAFDGTGTLFVADMENKLIRKITPGGTVSTLAGGYIEALWTWVKHGYSGEDDFRNACLRSLQASGNKAIFYVLQNSAEGFHLWLGNNVVLGMYILGTPSPVDGHRTDDWVKRSNAAGITTQVPVLFNSPDSFAAEFGMHSAYIQWVAASIAWAPSDQFIVCISHRTHLNAQISASWTADYVNQLAGQVKSATGRRFKVAIHDTYPECLTWGRGGNVDLIYVERGQRSEYEMATILAEVRAQTGKAAEARSTGVSDGVGAGVTFTGPGAVAVDGAGNVLVADYLDHTLRRVSPAGEVTTLAGSTGSAGSVEGTGSAVRFQRPLGIAVDRTENIFVADTLNHTVRKGLIELRLAVNAPALTFTTGGDVGWYGQVAASHDGQGAARSGPIGDGQQSWMQTTVTGPGSLLYWWKVSSESGGDNVNFSVDGASQGLLSGDLNWKQSALFLGAGVHTLRWSYTKNSALAAGADSAWVDEVQWVACEAATNAPQLFFQTSGGLLCCWVMNSSGAMRFARFLGNPEGWSLQATGDVNRDGVADLIFQSADGRLACWFMNVDGTTRGSTLLAAAGAWVARACTDYDGDGLADLFFQHASGDVAYWTLSTNGACVGAHWVGNMGGWRLKTAAPGIGGTRGDLFWQDASGLVAAWYRNANGTIRGQLVGNTGVWELRGAVDFDGNNASELLWQTPDTHVAGWFMNTNGTQRSGNYWGTTPAWKLKAAGR